MSEKDSKSQKVSVETEEETEFDEEGNFRTYHEYNKVLRTWFVAFGIAGPSLFVVNENLARRLASKGVLEWVATLFLVGVTAQILMALVNKIANWYAYIGCIDVERAKTWQCKTADWVLERFWVDIVVDILTIVVFVWAGWTMLGVLSA